MLTCAAQGDQNKFYDPNLFCLNFSNKLNNWLASKNLILHFTAQMVLPEQKSILQIPICLCQKPSNFFTKSKKIYENKVCLLQSVWTLIAHSNELPIFKPPFQ